MSDVPQGPGWWQASDGHWYPPETAPGAAPTYSPPMGNQPFGPPSSPFGAQWAQPYSHMPPRTEPLAITSLACAIVGTVLGLACGVGFLATIASIPFGFVARKRIRESNGTLTGDGLALAGLIIGIVVVGLFVLLIGVIFVLAASDPANGN